MEAKKGASVTSVVIAGLGGQGVLKASDILARVAFQAGLDVKKSELHGMSQRGGSVSSEVRFGTQVWSPMVPKGEADFLIVLAPDQEPVFRHVLKPDGVLIGVDKVVADQLPDRRSLNVALLGVLSRYLDFPEELWRRVITEVFPRVMESNWKAFQLGRSVFSTQ